MEESIGYEALFSSEEWESLTFGSWDDPDLDPYEGYSENGPSAASSEYEKPGSETGSSSSLSGVVAIDGEGCAAPSQAATSERAIADLRVEFIHEVSCRTRTLDDGTSEYVLECDICEEIGTAEDYEEADVIAQQHRRVTSDLWQVS